MGPTVQAQFDRGESEQTWRGFHNPQHYDQQRQWQQQQQHQWQMMQQQQTWPQMQGGGYDNYEYGNYGDGGYGREGSGQRHGLWRPDARWADADAAPTSIPAAANAGAGRNRGCRPLH